MSSSTAEEQQQLLQDLPRFEACCAGLTPVLEAVDELPASGLPIPASAQSRVRQFFVEQVSSAPAAGGSASPSTGSPGGPAGSRSLCVRPKGLQDTKQLQEALQKHVKTVWVLAVPGQDIPANLTSLVSAAISLVADAAHQVARQQVIEKNSSAYGVLLDEGYRAGVMAQSCAALKAALGLRIISHLQLARVMAVGCDTVSRALTVPSQDPGVQYQVQVLDLSKVSSYAWRHLKAYYSGGNSPPAWASGGMTAGLWLSRLTEVAVPCFKESALPPGTVVYKARVLDTLAGSTQLAEEGPAAGLAALVAGLGGAMCGCGKPSCPCCSMPADAAVKQLTGQQASSGKASSSAAGAGSSGAAAGKSSAGVGSIAAEADLDMSLPLDDCPLLAAQCVNLTPLLAAVAAWVQAGSGDTAAVRAAVKAYAAGQAASCNNSSSSGGGGGGSGGGVEGGGGSRRRTLVPSYYRYSNNDLQGVKTVLTLTIGLFFMDNKVAAHCKALPELVLGVLREVAREQVVEKGSAAYEALCRAGCMAGGVVLACSVLSRELHITIQTEQQLFQAVKQSCEARRSALAGTSIEDTAAAKAVQRSYASSGYQLLLRITGSSSGGGSSGDPGAGSSSKPSVPPCSLDDAYAVVGAFDGCLATMWETQGVVTAAEARARKAQAPAVNDGALLLLNALASMTGAGAAGTAVMQWPEAAGGSTASSSEQEVNWGKGSALAGLKGLFQRGAASIQKGAASIQKGTASKAAAPAATPVAVRTSSSGAVVASTASKQQSAPAAAAAAKAGGQPGKAAAAAATSSSSGNTSSSGTNTTTKASSSSSSTAGTAKAQSTPAELLEPNNLKKWFWSPDTFSRPPGRADCVKVLPTDALQALVKLKLHTTKDVMYGWNALHYACAAQRIELVEQLIEAGAPVSEPEDSLGLQPLHLACIGGITAIEQYHELMACITIADLQQYVGRRDAFSADLVALLLKHGADPAAFADIGRRVDSSDAAVAPLHILTFYAGGPSDGRLAELVFNNPFIGKAVVKCAHALTAGPRVIGLYYAHLDLMAASKGALSIRSNAGQLDTRYRPEDDKRGDTEEGIAALESLSVTADVPYDASVAMGIARVRACQMLLDKGADVDTIAEPTGETPLMTAAACGNTAALDVLLRAGADPEKQRYDGARALEVAADKGFCTAGWTLMCHGAVAVPQWMRAGKEPPKQDPGAGSEQLVPQMLLSHATQCDASPWNILFLDRLLAEWPELEGVWQETGETPLLAAVTYNDNEMVRRLVRAGADVNATLEGTDTPALAQALYKGGRDDDTQDIVQTLIDAGAEIHSWQSSSTEYDMLQTAANESNLEASLKLVEARAKWQMPKQERVRDGSVYYAPEILAISVPGLKLNFVEARFRLAEKTGRGKRAAAAATLQRWLSPDVAPECKEATLRALCRALDGRDHITMQHRASRPLLGAPAAAAGTTKGWKTLPGVPQQVQAGSAGGQQGRAGAAAAAAARPAADPNDIDAVLAEIESVGASGASAAAGTSSSSSKAASKKKKKETAAQKEARKKQQQRLQRLQQQEQEQGSESGSDSEAAAAATTTAEAEVASSTASGPASASLDAGQLAEAILAEAMQQSTQQAALLTNGQQAHSLEQQEQQQQSSPQQQAKPQQQLPKQKAKKGKAGKQQQQQEAGSSEGVSRPSSAPQQQPAGPRTPTPASPQKPAELRTPAAAGPASPAAAAMPPKRPSPAGSPAAAASTKASAAAAAAAAAPAAAAPSAPPPAGGTSPQPVTAARAAFLPPHLRMSMPGLAAPAPPAAAPPAAAAALQPQQQHQQPPPQQQRVSGLQARMVELAQQHQLQQQQAVAPPPQQQQQGPAKGSAPVLPELPSAMMAFLSGAAQRQAPAGTTAGHAGSSKQQHNAQHPMGSKRQQQGMGAAAARAAAGGRASPTAGAPAAAAPAGVPRSPAAGASPATAAGAPAAAGKGPKPCVVCAQRRRNVLLIPCNHMVLCEACAEQLAGKGALGSCPTCHKPVKQRIRVHQS